MMVLKEAFNFFCCNKLWSRVPEKSHIYYNASMNFCTNFKTRTILHRSCVVDIIFFNKIMIQLIVSFHSITHFFVEFAEFIIEKPAITCQGYVNQFGVTKIVPNLPRYQLIET